MNGRAARLGYVDVVKGLVVAGVVVAHAGMTYGFFGQFAYREEPLHPLPGAIGSAFGVLTALGMGLLFLIAGMFTPAAVARGGASRYLADRLARLGLPLAGYVVVVMPVLNFLGRWAAGSSPAAAATYAAGRLAWLDAGPAWFLLALLLVTLAYLAARSLKARWVDGANLWALALLAAAATFGVRVLQPVDDPAPVNVAGWPIDFALFWLGACVAARGWLQQVPRPALRRSKALIALGLAVLAPLALIPSGTQHVLGGWHWQSAVVSAGESLATIGLAVWLLRQFQRIPRDPVPWFTHSSFGAYLAQSPVVVLLGIAMRPLTLPVALKFLVLAALSIAASFALPRLTRGRARRLRPARAASPT